MSEKVNKLIRELEEKLYNKISKEVKIIEWCSDCGGEVEINTHYHLQNCPSCGEPIKPCSNCIMDKVECHECPLDILNKKNRRK